MIGLPGLEPRSHLTHSIAPPCAVFFCIHFEGELVAPPSHSVGKAVPVRTPGAVQKIPGRLQVFFLVRAETEDIPSPLAFLDKDTECSDLRILVWETPSEPSPAFPAFSSQTGRIAVCIGDNCGKNMYVQELQTQSIKIRQISRRLPVISFSERNGS